MFLADLENYSSGDIVAALSRCRKELKTFPTVADVVARIDDGRPGPEEAWAMIPKSEQDSTVWNEEISEAFAICRPLILEGDSIAARMAFKESYLKIIYEGRSKGTRPTWTPTFGFDKSARDSALQEAYDKKRLSYEQIHKLMPEIAFLSKDKPKEIVGPDDDGQNRIDPSKVFIDFPKTTT